VACSDRSSGAFQTGAFGTGVVIGPWRPTGLFYK